MKQVAKRIVDLAMVVLLPLLMLEILIGQETHEWLGAGMLALFAAHHLMNLGWWRGLLKSLFDGNIRPFEQFGRLTPEGLTLMKEAVAQEEQLLSQLDENTAETLRTYQAGREEGNYLVTLERFRDAFVLGARMMMEILSNEARHNEI